MDLTDIERDTVLAGLRALQERLPDIIDTDSSLLGVATNLGAHDPATTEEIDQLCERLNEGVTIETPRASALVQRLAGMYLEGECKTHGHPYCGQRECCTIDCDTGEPAMRETLNDLIASARQLPRSAGDDDGTTAFVRDLARDQYQNEGELEIDNDATVSFSHNHESGAPCHNADPEGAYVAAWVYVDLSEEEAGA